MKLNLDSFLLYDSRQREQTCFSIDGWIYLCKKKSICCNFTMLNAGNVQYLKSVDKNFMIATNVKRLLE